MTRYVERLDEVREFLGKFDKVTEERREELLACKCWFYSSSASTQAVFRTRNDPDSFYEYFIESYWAGGREARGFWTS